MDFAKKQLLKMGWSEGKGLGKNEDGISTAIKPKLKFDRRGVGHKFSEDFENTNWWEEMYNKAAGSIQTLEFQEEASSGDEDEKIHATSKKNSILNMTDDELLSICGGRTAHKGSRHGITQSAKLNRIKTQEEILLEKKSSSSEEINLNNDVSNDLFIPNVGIVVDSKCAEDKIFKSKNKNATEKFLEELNIEASAVKKCKSKKTKHCKNCKKNMKTCLFQENNYERIKKCKKRKYEDLEVNKKDEEEPGEKIIKHSEKNMNMSDSEKYPEHKKKEHYQKRHKRNKRFNKKLSKIEDQLSNLSC